MRRPPPQILELLNGPEDFRVVVIRTWTERGQFRARMILQPGDDTIDDLLDRPPGEQAELDRAAQVVVTDSIDWLCDSLRAFLAQHAP